MSLCRFIGIDYLSRKLWEKYEVDDTDIHDLQYVVASSNSTISTIAFNSVIMNAAYIHALYHITRDSDSNLRRFGLALFVGSFCANAYDLIIGSYNKQKAQEKINDIIKNQPEISYATQVMITPFPEAALGMDDDNSYDLNDTTHPIFNVFSHGFEPHVTYRLYHKDPAEWMDSPPFKTSEDAVKFAQYIDGLVNSTDMFDYVKYLYNHDIKDIYINYDPIVEPDTLGTIVSQPDEDHNVGSIEI